jgi:3-keto-disaccharide hydrolase
MKTCSEASNCKLPVWRYLVQVLILIAVPVCASGQNNSLTEAEVAEGWTLLFDGNSMNHWRNFRSEALSDKWAVENGTMKLTGEGGGDILTRKVYTNFDLRLEWKISEAGNSGIFILVDEEGKHIYSHAPEIQILDNDKHSDKKIDSHRSGSLYDMVASHPSSHKPAGEWNQVRILFRDGFLQVWQNGVKTVNITLGDSTWNTLLKGSKFGGAFGSMFGDFEGFGEARSGHIGLQDHSDPVAFKNIKIKELD